jgi:hypothetical protein
LLAAEWTGLYKIVNIREQIIFPYYFYDVRYKTTTNRCTIVNIRDHIIFPYYFYDVLYKTTTNLLLERVHRYVCKYVQGLPKLTRTDKCTTLLGWTSIECYIDSKKLLFLGKLCNMPSRFLPKQIFITRLLLYLNNCTTISVGFIQDIIKIWTVHVSNVLRKQLHYFWLDISTFWMTGINWSLQNCQHTRTDHISLLFLGCPV